MTSDQVGCRPCLLLTAHGEKLHHLVMVQISSTRFYVYKNQMFWIETRVLNISTKCEPQINVLILGILLLQEHPHTPHIY